MTRNNLTEQLSWLLKSKLSIPSTANALPSVSLSFTQAQPTQAAARTSEPEVAVEDTNIEAIRADPALAREEQMARLRTETGSAAKPSLVTMGPRHDQTPLQTAQGDTPRQRTGGQARTTAAPRATPYSTARMVPASPHPDVEIMDLTETLAQTRSPTAVLAGRKRKSSEMESDAPPATKVRSAPTRPAQAMPAPPRGSQQSFTAIDEIMEEPTEPPPPYSTFAPRQVSPVRLVPHKPSLAGTSVGVDDSPVMPDSEEDEDDLIDFSRSRSRPMESKKTTIAMAKPWVRHAASESPSKPAAVARAESNLLPAQSVETALRKTFSPAARSDDKRPAQVDSKTAPSSATATQRAKTEDEIAVERFFGLGQRKIQECCQRLNLDYEERLNVLADLIENDQESETAQRDLDEAEARYHSFQRLASKQDEHKTLLVEKEPLSLALREALRLHNGTKEAKAAIDACKAKMQALLNESCELMGRCRTEVLELLKRAGEGEGGSRKVAVQSTQAQTANVVANPACVPSSSRIAQTQVVKVERSSASLSRRETGVVRARRESTPDIEAYFSPSRRNQQPPPRTEAKASYARYAMPDEDPDTEFGEVDENDLFEASNHMFTNRMSPPPAHRDDEDEFGDVDMLDFAEAYEDYGAQQQRQQSRGDPSRPPLAQTSGNAQAKADYRSPKKKKRTPAKHDDANLEHLFHYPWGADVKETLRKRFRLRGFRENQLDAINATLDGKDVFVLMPTGGGKSLCYQLPALIRSGKTLGVTVVVSPLLSLMEDQVQHLRDLNVQAFLINSETTQEKRNKVMAAMEEPDVEDYVQLLYVTPEMLNKSERMINAFVKLYRRQRLARLVIDEAHCVSQWGHDFRPDYKLLGDVRQRFPSVPVMALTATATENVKADTVHNLGIDGCEIFTSSFNRPNLYYEVRMKPKGKEDVKQIAELIKEKYPRKTGIIYCFSRKECEKMAENLQKQYKIKAHHYHAGVDPQKKREIQKMWQAGDYQVIVATIAFGMGIDKADVRFVIHHTIPKSLEGYYQETGRAGRDQLPSGCHLFYGYQDAAKLRRMIDDNEGSWEQKERQHQMLRRITQYCDNESDCRRVQVLRYFNEDFDREQCNAQCDNCNSISNFETVDFTEYAQQAVSLVSQVASDKVTLLHCMDVFRGASNKKITDKEHFNLKEFAAGQELDRGDIERLFYRLITERAISEENVMNKKSGFAVNYVKLGKHCSEFLTGRRKFSMQIRSTPQKPKAKAPAKKKAKKDVGEEQSKDWRKTAGSRAPTALPMSTNVSSPIQEANTRRKPNRQGTRRMHSNGYEDDSFVVPDEDGDYAAFDDDASSEGFEDMFEPIREAGKPISERQRSYGGPIKGDKTMDNLDEIHRDLVENFVQDGRKEAQRLVLNNDLRITPFSDTMLRSMAINWTETEEQMLRIPDINHDNVRLHGKRFCKLLKKFHQHYDDAMGGGDQTNPDARNVINLVSDDEGEDDEDFGDISMDEDEPGESSGYFQPAPPASARVAAFNAQIDGLDPPPPPPQGGAGSSKPKKGGKGGKKRAYKATGSTAAPRRDGFSGGSRFNSYSYNENGPSGAGAGKKKAVGKRRSSGDGGKSGGGRSAPKNAGGAKQSIISMMPI